MKSDFSPSRRTWNVIMTALVWAAAVLVIAPTARMQPVTMPSMLQGSTMVRMMCHLPAPRPRAPSR